MKTNEKGLIQILLVIGILAVLGVIGWVLLSPKKTGSVVQNYLPSPTVNQDQHSAPINNQSDLKNTSASLDSTDTTQMDAELNALDKDLSSF